MKKIIFILFVGLLFSCSKHNEPAIQNKVMLLKVDFLTNEFEGGLEFEFSTSANFTPPY